MDSDKIIQELEERIKVLEEKLNHIVFGDNNTISITSSSFASVTFGDHCEANFHNSTAGSVINGNFEDAEDKLDELESRMDELESRIDEND